MSTLKVKKGEPLGWLIRPTRQLTISYRLNGDKIFLFHYCTSNNTRNIPISRSRFPLIFILCNMTIGSLLRLFCIYWELRKKTKKQKTKKHDRYQACNLERQTCNPYKCIHKIFCWNQTIWKAKSNTKLILKFKNDSKFMQVLFPYIPVVS